MAAARGSRSAWRRLGRCPDHADRKRQRAIGGSMPHRFPTRHVSLAGHRARRWRGLSGAARRHPVLPAVHGPSFPAAAFCRCTRAIRNRANRVRRHAQSHAICTRNQHVKRKRNSCRDFSRAHATVRCASRDDACAPRRGTMRRRRKRPPDFSGGRPRIRIRTPRRAARLKGSLNAPAARASPDSACRRWRRRLRFNVPPRAAPPSTQRAAKGGTGRCSGPSYQDSGRISRLSAPCSNTCAAQPVIRDATKIGVNSGISKPIR